MDEGHPILQLLSSTEFFEGIGSYAPATEDFLFRVAGVAPVGWSIHRGTMWYECGPDDLRLPEQGWKIHVSAILRHANAVLDATAATCIEHGTAFKFALDRRVLMLMNSNRWPRGGSGKFITIYPTTATSFKELLRALETRLRPFRGPFILSDRRYGDSSCIYYRYGGLSGRRLLSSDGGTIEVLVGPDGEQFVDERRPRFQLPPWERDPFVAASPQTAPAEVVLGDGRFRVERSITHTNCGGVYLALDTLTGTEVLIKEARPNTGDDPSGRDATDRLRREHRFLTQLAGTGVVPESFGLFPDWEHLFLVQEFIQGRTLADFTATHRNVILHSAPGLADVEHFVREAAVLWQRLLDGVHQVHEHGIVFGDLSPYNVIVDPDSLEITLIDLGGAYELGVDEASMMFTQGFAKGPDQLATGFERDYFALGALLMSSLWPMTALVELDPGSIARFLHAISRDFGLPSAFEETILCLLTTEPDSRLSLRSLSDRIGVLKSWSMEPVVAPHVAVTDTVDGRSPSGLGTVAQTLTSSAAYLASALTPDRDDRIAPGDMEIYRTNPLGLAYGAAGIVLALNRLGIQRPDAVDWLIKRLNDPATLPPGLYSGLAGIAWSLLESGHTQRAAELMLTASSHDLLMDSVDVFDGAAGVGLAALQHWWRLRDARFLEAAARIAESILRSATADSTGICWPNEKLWTRLGYGYGPSGVAEFLLGLYCATRDRAYLDSGWAALNFDLIRLQPSPDGALTMAEFGRTTADLIDTDGGLTRGRLLPYLMQGSAGIGRVLLRFQSVAPSPDVQPTLEGLIADARRKYTIYPTLFVGLAGLGDFLLDCHAYLRRSECRTAAIAVSEGIELFAIRRAGGTAFPGTRLSKISCDLGSGGAGVAMFIARLLHGGPTALPDLGELFRSTSGTAATGSLLLTR